MPSTPSPGRWQVKSDRRFLTTTEVVPSSDWCSKQMIQVVAATSQRLSRRQQNRIGFDSVDAGTIADSWRQQPGSSVYCTNPTKAQLQLWLKKVDRSSLPADREKGSKAYYPTKDADYQA